MTDRDVLLANVLNDPTDDTARLVLADWLEEHGEELCGQFVRAGVLAAQYHARDQLDDPTYYEFLRAIAAVVTSGGPARWLSALGLGPSPLTSSDWVWDNTGDRVTVRIGGSIRVFARGLLSELAVPLAEWYEFAPRALALARSCPANSGTRPEVPGPQSQGDAIARDVFHLSRFC